MMAVGPPACALLGCRARFPTSKHPVAMVTTSGFRLDDWRRCGAHGACRLLNQSLCCPRSNTFGNMCVTSECCKGPARLYECGAIL
eukprot:6193353-Pleurochrysis_carterae.AAC.5